MEYKFTSQKIEVEKIILAFALRYAIGRNTFATDYVYKALEANVHNFKRWELAVLADDIIMENKMIKLSKDKTSIQEQRIKQNDELLDLITKRIEEM